MRDRLHAKDRTRELFAVLLAVPAVALTAFVAYAGFDMATTTYVGYEIGLTRAVAITAAVLAVLCWAGVVALRRSARRDR